MQVIETASDILMFQEYVPGGEIFEYIVEHGRVRFLGNLETHDHEIWIPPPCSVSFLPARVYLLATTLLPASRTTILTAPSYPSSMARPVDGPSQYLSQYTLVSPPRSTYHSQNYIPLQNHYCTAPQILIILVPVSPHVTCVTVLPYAPPHICCVHC